MELQIDHLTKRFKNQVVLDDISQHIQAQALALIGASGSGKTTLLKIIGGLLQPDQGSVGLNQLRLPNQEKPLIDYRRQLGYVFQQSGLFAHMTALDNLVCPLVQVHKLDKTKALDISERLLKQFGLWDQAHKKPHALSGGQQQRIAIARAMAHQPKVLLLDEPTSALDPEYTVEVLDMLKELQEDGVQMIIVTHEMGFARKACDQVAFLDKGKLVEVGHSEQVFAEPQTKACQQFLSKILEWS